MEHNVYLYIAIVALFVMGHFLDKKPSDNEQGAASPDRKAQSDEK